MMAKSAGTIDYRDERFIARFPYDASLVAEIKTLRLGTRQKATDEWVIERHRPSVARLVRIGRDRSWRFTAEASKAIQQMQDEADAAEFSIDVVQGPGGEPWFLCMLGDDYELQQRVKRIPGAYLDDADDSWWVPATREESCQPLLEIAESDDRLTVSSLAWERLEEPDLSFELPRSATSAVDGEPREPLDDVAAIGGTWEPTELDYEMHTLSSATHEDCFRVSSALRGTLLPYQIAGVRYLCSATRAFLADDLGLGKTAQALATIETLGAYPALILCPTSLRLQWMHEAQRWLPESRTLAVLGRASDAVPAVDVLIVDYESLGRSHQLLGERGFETIIADESHYLRNREAPRTQAAIEVASTVPTLRLCLSATPMAGSPVELAPQLEFLGLLDQEFGGFWPFASRYCAPKNDGTQTRFGAARRDELAQRLRSTCYCRREKAAVLAQLPDKPRAVHRLELADRGVYRDAEDKAREALRSLLAADAQDDTKSADYAARRAARQRESLGCVQALMHECGRQKTASIARWVANFLSSGEPLVVFAQHPDVIGALRESFPRALSITSADTPAQQKRTVRAFQAGEAQLIVCAMHAAGVAGTLTRAAHVAFAEVGWSAASHDEAEARIHRIGNERAAMAWYLVGDGTLDELVLDVIERQRVMAGQLHDSVLLEVAQELARLTEPRSSTLEASHPRDALARSAG